MTTPTIVRGESVSFRAAKRMRCPTAPPRGNQRRASAWLTMTTGTVSTRSDVSKRRPSTRRCDIVSKYPGVMTRYAAPGSWPGRGTGRPSTRYRNVQRSPAIGRWLMAPADVTPGSAAMRWIVASKNWPARSRIGRRRALERHAQRHDAGGLEAEMYLPQREQRASEQPRGDQQQQRESDFRRHQRVTGAPARRRPGHRPAVARGR